MLEILYLNYNRAEFAKTSFAALVDNTNWNLVDRLVVYDDGSVDGADEVVLTMGREAPVPAFDFRRARFNSPPVTMNDYLAKTEADVFAKIDSDICVPPGWLVEMLRVMNHNPELELLGMEAGRGRKPRKSNRYTYEPASHIGGVGLMKTQAFHSRPAIPAWGYQGFTHWQDRHKPVLGFISPYLLCPALDRIPVDPWASLSDYYHERSWQRTQYHWRYDLSDSVFWKWLPSEVTA